MYVNDTTKPIIRYLMTLGLPDVFMDVNANGDVQTRCGTQALVRAFRSKFRGVIWKKQHHEGLGWSYNGDVVVGRYFSRALCSL